MKNSFLVCAARWIGWCFLAWFTTGWANAKNYQNFDVSIYIPVQDVNHFAEPGRLEQEWATISSQLKVDKVYIESTRGRVVAEEALLEKVKAYFVSKGVRVAGGMTFEATGGYLYESYCYTDPKDRDFVKKIVETTARHFDEIILDDFFFVTTKRPSDVAAKGNRSWTEFRLALMDEVSENLLLKPAKAVNPHLKFVIKYPNWYEHFQGLGFDLEKGPKLFDGIYTGTETRDPVTTDQCLQAYESYEIMRYFENIRPGGNGGGWVDTFGVRYVDRYSEQLWDTILGKAREITLFCWPLMLETVRTGDRSAWEYAPTSFNFNTLAARYEKSGRVMTMAAVAAQSLEQVDAFAGRLGRPIGIPSYKPHHSLGEDFLQNYLGMAGLPIEMMPDFPTDAPMILLTEQAKADPALVSKIKAQLDAGRDVTITSGLLHALAGKGLEEIIEASTSDRKALVNRFAYGFAGRSEPISGYVQIPVVNFLTNDAWPLVRGEAESGSGFPLLLMDRYTHGQIFILTIPDDFADLYRLPREVLDQLRQIILRRFPVQIDAPGQVALFAYDNDTFVVESFLDRPVEIKVKLPMGYARIKNLETGKAVAGVPQTPLPFTMMEPKTEFTVELQPHSYAAFAAEK